MKLLGRVFLNFVLLLMFAAVAIYVDGSRVSVNHSTTVSGIGDAPPARVFELIGHIGWRVLAALREVG